jgi:ketosteroid isomerase-like protein
VHFSNKVTTLDQDSPDDIGTDGNTVWETGERSLTYQVEGGAPVQQKGYHSSIAVRDGGVWKKRLITWNITPAPPAPAQMTKKETVDPQIIEQLNANGKKYDEAVNNNDAAAIAALFTEDGIFVRTQD